MRRVGWVLGWAVPEAWFAPLARAALPDDEHVFFPATPDTLVKIRAAGPFDWIVGYSLGAQLLLAAETVERVDPNALSHGLPTESALGSTRSTIRPRVALLAPILAFPAEENMGGRVARAQVRFLARWLRRDRPAALADFYARAGLDVPPHLAAELPAETLAWGLAQLETLSLPPALPPCWRAWCGADDALLDAARLRALAPEISIVAGATHHPAALLRAFAAEVERVDPNALANTGRRSALGSTRSTRAASFARAARGYHRHATAQAELAAWLAAWRPTECAGRALEIGAGTGGFTRHLAGWPGGVTATDFSPEMVAAGRAGAPWADWRVAAAAAPPPGPWAWIFSSAMLQWADEPEAVFSAWRAALAPGGRVLAALFAAGSLPEWHAVAGGRGPLRWRTAEEWRAALTRSGLRLVRDTVEPRVFTHGNARAFLRSVHGVGAAPERRLGAGALRQILRDYDARFAVSGGGVRATWRFYRFEAERE